ncbi:11985_t:CDS:2, partial [Dentiscutata erythropus]
MNTYITDIGTLNNTMKFIQKFLRNTTAQGSSVFGKDYISLLLQLPESWQKAWFDIRRFTWILYTNNALPFETGARPSLQEQEA